MSPKLFLSPIKETAYGNHEIHEPHENRFFVWFVYFVVQ